MKCSLYNFCTVAGKTGTLLFLLCSIVISSVAFLTVSHNQVQAGAGGVESMDWAAMIMNMYQSWAQRRGYTVTVIEEMPGELAGIKVCLFFYHVPLLNSVNSPHNYRDLALVVSI